MENTVQKLLGKIFEVKRDINEEKMEMVIKKMIQNVVYKQSDRIIVKPVLTSAS